MADLISRAAACECIGKMIHEYREKGEHALADGMILARRYGIKRLPAVDAAPVVYGRWQIRESGPGEIECKCSVCKYRDFVPRNDVYWVNRKFCPNCGAKMDGERRDSE